MSFFVVVVVVRMQFPFVDAMSLAAAPPSYPQDEEKKTSQPELASRKATSASSPLLILRPDEVKTGYATS